jgi:hypothetical protein
MNEILVHSLANRIIAGLMTMEQVPPIYREAVQERLDIKSEDSPEPEEP